MMDDWLPRPLQHKNEISGVQPNVACQCRNLWPMRMQPWGDITWPITENLALNRGISPHFCGTK